MTTRAGEGPADPAAKPARARLLLVDDDTRILSGLRRQLHREAPLPPLDCERPRRPRFPGCVDWDGDESRRLGHLRRCRGERVLDQRQTVLAAGLQPRRRRRRTDRAPAGSQASNRVTWPILRPGRAVALP